MVCWSCAMELGERQESRVGTALARLVYVVVLTCTCIVGGNADEAKHAFGRAARLACGGCKN